MSKVTCPPTDARAISVTDSRHPYRIMHPTLKIALASAVLAAAMPATVNAQSSSGNISGEAVAGDTVTITGVDTGFRRELKIDKDGKYQIRRVPTGDYQVVRTRKDGSRGPVQSVSVRVGSTARVIEPAPVKPDGNAGT